MAKLGCWSLRYFHICRAKCGMLSVMFNKQEQSGHYWGILLLLLVQCVLTETVIAPLKLIQSSQANYYKKL